MVSSIGCGLSMIGLGGYMWLRNYWIANNFQLIATWFPVLCIFSYTITCTLGFLVIPWVMIGEVYPTQVRGIIGGLTTMAAHSFIFTVVKTVVSLLAQLLGTVLSFFTVAYLYSAQYTFICVFPKLKVKRFKK